jgi:DNA invertase Pin-like site-specific DNA recombinase
VIIGDQVLLGYARVSTMSQDAGFEAQLRDLRAAGIADENIYSEKISARAAQRPEFDALLRGLRKDDVLVVCKLDRLCRSVKDAMEILEAVEKRGASLRVLNMGLDTATATGRLVISVMASIAEFESAILKERQREGVEACKARHGYSGRQPTARKKSIAVMAMNAAGVHKTEIAEQLGIGIASVYRILADEKKRQPVAS